MIELRTLGILDLVDAQDGRRIDSVLAQPKRLALLCYLALAARNTFRSRDTLLALFWPELDDVRARQSLRQSLYFLRRSLGAEAIISRGDGDVGIDHAMLRCDVTEFEATLDGGDAEEALARYGGDLLPGFHLSDAPDFERWLDGERRRLRQRALAAATFLAREQESLGNRLPALEWLRRARDLDPWDEALLRNQLTLMAELGDRSGAILEFTRFAERLRSELELEPDAATLGLIEELRNSVPSPVDATTATVALPPRSPELAAPTARHRRVALTGALGISIFLWLSLRPADLPQAADASIHAAAARTVALLPVEVEGETRYEFLARGLPDLLAGALSVPDIIEVIAPNPSGDRPGSEPFPTQVGAAVHVSGALIDVGEVARVQLTARDAAGAVLGTANAQIAEEDSLFGAIDDLAAQLLGVLAPGRAGDATRIVSSGTRSVAALRAYLSGERNLRAGNFAEAVRHFGDAVAEDSLFAAAHYRLSVAAAWSSDPLLEWSSVKRAFLLAADLPEPFRLLALAKHSMLFGRDGPAAELALRQATRRFPRDGDAAYQLADLYFHRGGIWGIEAGIVREHFERASRLDPSDAAAILHLARLAAYEGDVRRLLELSDRLSTLDGEGHALEVRALTALRAPASPILHEVREEFRSLDDPALIQAVFRMAAYARNPADAWPFAELLTSPERPPPTAAMGHIALASLAVAGGRLDEARGQLERAESLDRRLALVARALFASLPWLPADSAELRLLSVRLRASTDALTAQRTGASYPAGALLNPSLGTFLSGMIAVRRGNAEEAAMDMERLRGRPSADYLHRLLEASLLASSDSGRGLAVLGEESRAWDADAAGIETWLRGRLLASMDRERDALRWFGAFAAELPYAFLGAAPSHMARARILERLGDPEASAHYARVIELWSDADPILQNQVELARERLGALTAGR